MPRTFATGTRIHPWRDYPHRLLADIRAVQRRLRPLWVAAVASQGAAFAAVALAAVAAGARGELSPGQVVFYIQLAWAMHGVIEQFDLFHRVGRGLLAFQHLLELERTLPQPAVGPRARVGDRPRQEIRIERLGFRYPGQPGWVFRDLDLVIPAGRSLAIVGPNGAGKTTLVKLLAGLYAPTAGRILVDGVDLGELDPAEWRRRIAVIFQDFCRWELPVRDNVGFGALELRDDDEALRRALRRAGAEEVVRSLPAGLATPLSPRFRNGVDLSGGQWQRIALARALLAVERGARVLILDEPTASLDARAEAEFYERFLELTAGLTTLLISHRFASVRLADRIVVLEGGRVVEQGTHNELMRLGGRYATLFRLQAERFQEEPGRDEGVATGA